MATATVILFKPSGKFYTEELWEVPTDAIGPYDMGDSKDFRRIAGGPVLVPSQEPWGFPHLFPGHAYQVTFSNCYPQEVDSTYTNREDAERRVEELDDSRWRVEVV